MTTQELRDVDRIILTSCGTGYHAALVGEYLIEALAHIPCEVEFASEFRYRNMPMDKDTLVLAVSQSGETIDTLAAVRESAAQGPPDAGGVQQRGEHDRARVRRGRLHARGPGDLRGGDQDVHLAGDGVHPAGAAARAHPAPESSSEGLQIIKAMEAIPAQIERVLETSDQIKEIAAKYAHAKGMLFMGRQYNYPIALEGSASR